MSAVNTEHTIERVNALLSDICPAMSRAKAARRIGVPGIEDVTFVTIFAVNGETGGKASLSQHEGATALSCETRHLMPAGRYTVQLFDTFFEAETVAGSLRGLNVGSSVELCELATGEGAVLVHMGDCVSTDVYAEMQASGDEKSLKFEGADGPVEITLDDRRAEADRRRDAFMVAVIPAGRRLPDCT